MIMRKEGNVKWYLKPYGVIILLFFVLGPLGLPLLFKSPAFSRKLKIILTVVVIIYSAYLIIAALEIGRKMYIEVKEYQSVLK